MSTSPQPTLNADFAVTFRELMLQSLSQEKEATKSVIAAVPDARREYRPDPKSRTAWELAWHIASEDVILLEQMTEQKFSLPDPRYEGDQPQTAAALADWYERKLTAAMAKVRALTPAQLTAPLDFLGMMTLPTFMYLSLVSNHSIHHRGQLSTYLRSMGSKVPSIYGPTADTAS